MNKLIILTFFLPSVDNIVVWTVENSMNKSSKLPSVAMVIATTLLEYMFLQSMVSVADKRNFKKKKEDKTNSASILPQNSSKISENDSIAYKIQ